MEHRQRDKTILSLKRCIEAKFTEGDWDELVYLTNGREIIYTHPRLLRSLRFGDEDYGSCVFEVIEQLITTNSSNLQVMLEYVNLPEWLKQNYPKDFEDLYGHTHPLLDEVEQTAISNLFQLNQHITRIRQAVESDPELAVGSTKELIESVLKTIIESFGEEIGKDDLPRLLKRVQKLLKLDPEDVNASTKGADIVKRTLSNLGQIVIGIDELRNIYGTGHGKVRRSNITPRHARLVVGAGAALSTFLMETYEFQKQSKQ